jgi:hypothetical protein
MTGGNACIPPQGMKTRASGAKKTRLRVIAFIQYICLAIQNADIIHINPTTCVRIKVGAQLPLFELRKRSSKSLTTLSRAQRCALGRAS